MEPTHLERRASELNMRGRYAEALKVRQELEEQFAQGNADVYRRCTNLNFATLLAVRIKNFPEAERAARKCLMIYRPLAEGREERLATYLMILSSVLAETRKFDEAIAVGDHALAIFADNRGADEAFVVKIRNDLDRMRAEDTQPYLSR